MNKQMKANEIFKELNIKTDYNEEKINLISVPLNIIFIAYINLMSSNLEKKLYVSLECSR